MANQWTPPDFAKPVNDETWTPPDFAKPAKKEEEPPKKVEATPEKKSFASRAWDWLNKSLTNIPSELASSISEPMMKYGEQGDSPIRRGALYGGAFLQSVGDVTSSLTSPLNLGLTVTSGGAGIAERAALPEVATALEAPSRIASAGMMAHGGYKALTGEDTATKIGGGVEAALGAFGLKGKGEVVPEESIKPKPKTNEFAVVKDYLSAIEKGDIPPETRLADFVQSQKGWTPPEFATPVDVKTPEESFVKKGDITEKQPEGTVLDEQGRVVAPPQPIIPERPPFHDVNALIDEKPTARFNAWQMDPTHPEGGFPLYDIQGGPSHGSTVSTETLKSMGVDVPETPTMPTERQIPQPIADYLKKSNIPQEVIDSYSPEEAIAKAQQINKRENIVPDPKKEVPINDSTEPVRNPTDSINKLKAALETSAASRSEQISLQSAARSQRVAAMESVTTPGAAGYYQQLGMLKGELPKIDIKTQLDQADVDSLVDSITNSGLLPFQRLNAKTGLMTLLSGKIPQANHAALLGKVFGQDFEDMIMLHGGLGTPGFKNLLNNTVNAPKSIMASFDLSAPLRQGLPLIGKKEYWNAFSEMFKYAGSEKTFRSLQDSLVERPHYELGENSGLFLADTGAELSAREEAFLSNYAEKIPVLGQIVKGSNRAYTGFLNKLRADTFDNLIDQAVSLGHKPEEIAPEIAKFVNTSTGRGSLGRFEKNAVELNAGLFSPRLIASRLTMLNPNYYVKMSPMVRKEALKALFSVAAAGSSVAALAKMAGADVNTNPTSSDFGKIKVGNTRLDPYGGFQQYIVAASRLISGEQTSIGGREYDLAQGKYPGPTRVGVISNLARSKESPIASFIDTMLSGQQAYPPSGLGQVTGEKFGTPRVAQEIVNRFTPMVINDLIDIYHDDPNLLPLGLAGVFGMGVQTMEPPASKSPFRLGVNKINAPRGY